MPEKRKRGRPKKVIAMPEEQKAAETTQEATPVAPLESSIGDTLNPPVELEVVAPEITNEPTPAPEPDPAFVAPEPPPQPAESPVESLDGFTSCMQCGRENAPLTVVGDKKLCGVCTY